MTGFRGAAVAFAVALLVFLPSTRYAFVYYDDPEYVMDNPNMQEGLTAENVRWAFASRTYAANWHPLTWLSLMGDVSAAKAVCGESPLKRTKNRERGILPKLMHSHNVLLHALNAALLFVLLSLIAGGRLAPVWTLGATLLWAVHPLRVEVVSWITERKELLSVFFMLLSLIFYIGSEKLKVKSEKCSGGFLARHSSFFIFHFSLLMFALALLAKPVAVTLPAVLLAWDWIVRGKPRWGRIVPFAVLSFGTCLMTIGAQDEAIINARVLGIASRLSTFFVSPLVYIRQTVWPFGLSAYYPLTEEIDWIGNALGLALIVAMAWVSVRWLRRREGWAGLAAFAVAWVYVGLLPMLGIIKVGGQEHSDRYTYWVGCGVAAVVVMALVRAKPLWGKAYAWLREKGGMTESKEQVRRMCAYGVLALVGLLAWATAAQQPRWRDPTVFFGETLQRCWDPDFAFGLAVQLVKQSPRGFTEGEMWLRECASRRPCVATYTKLAKFLLMKEVTVIPGFENPNPYFEAEMLIRQALEAEPEHKEALELKELLEKEKKNLKDKK